MSAVWSGSWVEGRTGIGVESAADSAVPMPDMVGLALRRNPRRAHLLVSTVLGKHVPTDPRIVYWSARLLGAMVADVLAGRRPDAAGAADALATALGGRGTGPLIRHCEEHVRVDFSPANTLVLGYAETATALGHAVADTLGADYLHSTRRRVPGVAEAGGFDEEHSHATRHLLLPQDTAMLERPGPLVLVDDELSTGRTVLNTIATLHTKLPRSRYVVASLVDLRSDADKAAMSAAAERLGTRIDVVALARGALRSHPHSADHAAALVAEHAAETRTRPPTPDRPHGAVRRSRAGWPGIVRDGGRHGFSPADRAEAERAAAAAGCILAGELSGDRALVLGFEELMYAPLLVALALSRESAAEVRFSTTTRSPVLPVDASGYAIRTALAFPAHDDPADGPGPRYAYNVAPSAGAPGFTDVVVVVDSAGDTAELHADGGLLDQLAEVCGHVHLVAVPAYTPVPAQARAAGTGR
ncbi:phosphoribosyltransferase family protein [Corynebacteriales bacterium D3-21]|uniref:Phosphoribosyltransferase family protein n=1 Tax=Speluncibacter jeojiensis TaxID=2710754 RepID=A0A9X4RCU6_9ACTN|nr:phosphoribosyltransferase family protein [Corynebacteriales bacterium D3-21]